MSAQSLIGGEICQARKEIANCGIDLCGLLFVEAKQCIGDLALWSNGVDNKVKVSFESL